jgi:hypothetical protein
MVDEKTNMNVVKGFEQSVDFWRQLSHGRSSLSPRAPDFHQLCQQSITQPSLLRIYIHRKTLDMATRPVLGPARDNVTVGTSWRHTSAKSRHVEGLDERKRRVEAEGLAEAAKKESSESPGGP